MVTLSPELARAVAEFLNTSQILGSQAIAMANAQVAMESIVRGDTVVLLRQHYDQLMTDAAKPYATTGSAPKEQPTIPAPKRQRGRPRNQPKVPEQAAAEEPEHDEESEDGQTAEQPAPMVPRQPSSPGVQVMTPSTPSTPRL